MTVYKLEKGWCIHNRRNMGSQKGALSDDTSQLKCMGMIVLVKKNKFAQ
jgi:hypothetical protein